MLIGALLLLAAVSSGGTAAPTRPAPGGRRRWVWPLPRLADGRRPVVSDPYGPSSGRADGHHSGVDVMYERPVKLPPAPGGRFADHGSRKYELPEGTPVLAASDGIIWSTAKSELGWSIVIAHGPDTRYATQYLHLDEIAVPRHRRGKLASGGRPMMVSAGQVIGTAGYSHRDGQQIRHLHFELRDGTRPLDPGTHRAGFMETWEIV